MSLFTIAQLTIREAQRRRILWVALIMGTLFLTIFGVGLHLIWREFVSANPFAQSDLDSVPAIFLTMAGLYVTNFLVVIMAVLISVAAISGEVENNLVDVLVTKPLYRWEIVLGKWLGFATMTTAYTLFLAGGVLLISYLRTGLVLRQPAGGIALLALNALLTLSVSIAGGTRLSTLANGVLAFMLYGIAFVGGWVETIGGLFRNETAVNLGITASLIMPIEALWRKASLIFEPRLLSNPNIAGPFAVTTEPSTLMIGYALVYMAGLLIYGVWQFGRRDL